MRERERTGQKKLCKVEQNRRVGRGDGRIEHMEMHERAEMKRQKRQEDREVEVCRMWSYPVVCLVADVKRKQLDQQGFF